MELKNLRIIFMGTPEFAVASLDALVKAGCNIVAVITAADKPAGRGMKLSETAVKKYALSNGLKILQPDKLKNADFLDELKSLNADLQIVVAFRMLPEIVWNMPPLGTINLHGSLLPQYRGAAPINWAIINGEKETGVTTFKLKHEIDTGNILMQKSFLIDENETAGEVHDKMKLIGAEVLLSTIKELAAEKLIEKQQCISEKNEPLNSAPKLFAETCKIDFSKTVTEVHNLIRGLSPFPGAFTKLGEKTVKIFRSYPEKENHAATIGTWKTDNKSFLKIACADGYISIKELQMEGKNKMKIEDFLRGFRSF